MRARLLHGPLSEEKEDAEKPCREEIKVKPGKFWSEVVIVTCEPKNVVHIAVETNNPKVAVEVAKQLMKLTWGDDIIYAEYKGGRLEKYIRMDLPPYFLDWVNPRDQKDWKEIAENSRIIFCTRGKIEEPDYPKPYTDRLGLNCVGFDEVLEYISPVIKEEPNIRVAKEVLRACRKLGDDLLNYVVNRKLEKYVEGYEGAFREFAKEVVREIEDP